MWCNHFPGQHVPAVGMLRLEEKGRISLSDEDSKLRRWWGDEEGEDDRLAAKDERERAWKRKAAPAKAVMNAFNRTALSKGTGQDQPVLMIQTQPQIPRCHPARFSSTNKTLANLPVLLQLLTARVSCHPLLSPTSRTLWGAVRAISTHSQCACCKSGTWESLRRLFHLFLKLSARAV